MIQLYIVDYLQNTTDVSSCIKNWIGALKYNTKVILNRLFVDSAASYDCFNAVKNEYGGQDFYVPLDIGDNLDPQSNKAVLNFISSRITNKGNIIFHFFWLHHCSFAKYLKDELKCNTVLTKNHNQWENHSKNSYPLNKKHLSTLFSSIADNYIHPKFIQENIIYDFIDHIICVSEFDQYILTKLICISPEKVSTVYYGIDHKKIRLSSKDSLRKKYGFGIDEKILFFPNFNANSSSIDDLLAVFFKLKHRYPLRLIIAGTGDYSKLLKCIKAKWSQITVVGNLDRKELYDFYQIADIGITLPMVSGLEYSVLEMFHFGLPVISSDVGGINEIVLDNNGLRVPLIFGEEKICINRRILMEKIYYLLDNPEIALQFASRARDLLRKSFTSDRMVEETVAVYESLIEREMAKHAAPPAKNNMPLVTVLLPCYNSEKYLKECIDSILKQSYAKFELLIINDGSIDKTGSIINQYKDDRIVYVENDKNEGIVKSLNKGIAIASGKYIARMDADDLMHTERLQKQVEFLERPENHDIGIVGCNHYIIDTLSKPISLRQYPSNDAEIRTIMLFACPFCHPSVLMRIEVFKKMKYPSNYKHIEDYALWFKIASKYQLANLPDFLTYYRIHETNVSQQHSKTQRENAARLLSSELDKLGFEHTPQQLAIHIATVFGFGQRYFNTIEKVEYSLEWIDNILRGLQAQNNHTEKFTKKMRTVVLQNCCAIF